MYTQAKFLTAVQGDIDAMRTLAAAIARNDIAAIAGVLRARGVAVGAGELSSLIQSVADGGPICAMPHACI